MKIQTCAKINLGLNVVAERPDGYHNLETVFYPVPIFDEITIELQQPGQLMPHPAMLIMDGAPLDCAPQKNLVILAYQALNERYGLPRVIITLKKNIPSQAGMGGGSSDCAATLRLLRDMFLPQVEDWELEQISATLGADCAFFVKSQPAYAEGIGDQLTPITLSLEGWWLAVVRPDIPVSTGAAYKLITCHEPIYSCREIVTRRKVSQWSSMLVNDFEEPVFDMKPEIGLIRDRLYQMGATYAAMSGSGSALFGLFESEPDLSAFQKPGTFIWKGLL